MENVLNYLKPQQDKYSDEWDTNLKSEDKMKMLAKLDMLADLSNYIDCLREGYTRTLKINNVVEVNNDEEISRVVKVIDTAESGSDTSISP
tara:strand:+ start:976 stop:1248 length:273 start_codon:yes stop_codon:yes gene_type:complete